jgi:hypothetical protein
MTDWTSKRHRHTWVELPDDDCDHGGQRDTACTCGQRECSRCGTSWDEAFG